MQDLDNKPQRFYEMLQDHLVKTLTKKHLGKAMTPPELRSMRETINGVITGLFAKSTRKLTKEALVWLTDQFFKHVRISNDQIVNDMVVINEYPLNELALSDIELLCELFSDTNMGSALKEELADRKKVMS